MKKDELSWQEKLALLSGSVPEAANNSDDECKADEVENKKPLSARCGKISIFFEKKGRGGKQATILAGFDNLEESELDELASEIKKKLGTGGSARGSEILIQGDRRKDIQELLRKMGFKVSGI